MGENGDVSDDKHEQETPTPVTIRRAPKVPVFLVAGGALGLIVTLLLVSLFPADKEIGYTATVGFFSLYGIPIGVAVGAIVALILDRRASKRAGTATARHLEVRPEAVADEPQAAPANENPSPEADGSGTSSAR